MWKEYLLTEGQVYYWCVGQVEFWVKREKNEWMIAQKKCTELSSEPVIAKEISEVPDLAWKNFISKGENSLHIVPALPNKPMVVKPKNNLALLPSVQAILYVKMPVWVQLYANEVSKNNLLTEFGTYELSDTWFGDPDNGTLAYAMPHDITTDLPDSGIDYELICPVEISNASLQQLNFERLLLHVNLLSLYKTEKYLCSNEISVKFKGESQVSDTNYGHTKPPFLPKAKQVSKPRNKERSSVLKKSFYFFKSLTEY